MNPKSIGKLIRGQVKKEVFARTANLFELNNKMVLSKKETAEMFSISQRTLDRWRDEGKIIALENVEKGKVLFSKNEVVRVLNEMGYGG